jgi:hypothetical protein
MPHYSYVLDNEEEINNEIKLMKLPVPIISLVNIYYADIKKWNISIRWVPTNEQRDISDWLSNQLGIQFRVIDDDIVLKKYISIPTNSISEQIAILLRQKEYIVNLRNIYHKDYCE